MGRWAPDAHGRLAQAAMELYAEHGYDATTVVEIAERAGLTERTFFRHFVDKREVLFAGATALQAFLVDQVDTGPEAPPMQRMTAALAAAASHFFDSGNAFARERQKVIAASEELQERELIKMAALTAAMAAALRRRGVGDPSAELAAEAGMAVFRVAFARWAGSEGEDSLAEHLQTAAATLAAVAL